MKRCPSCNMTYAEVESFCHSDGTPLINDAPSYDLQATIAAPQVYGNSGNLPNYQPYQPQQQQWSPQPAIPLINMKVLIGTIVGLVLVVGIGLLIYFLTHPSSVVSSSTNPYNSPSTSNDGRRTTVSSASSATSSASDQVAGTWKNESNPNYSSIVLSDDGTFRTITFGKEDHRGGTYTLNGDRITFKGGPRLIDGYTFILEGGNRMKSEKGYGYWYKEG